MPDQESAGLGAAGGSTAGALAVGGATGVADEAVGAGIALGSAVTAGTTGGGASGPPQATTPAKPERKVNDKKTRGNLRPIGREATYEYCALQARTSALRKRSGASEFIRQLRNAVDHTVALEIAGLCDGGTFASPRAQVELQGLAAANGERALTKNGRLVAKAQHGEL
jgi:hypothetical protein